MTRARWAIALALGAAALAVGADALITYVKGGLVVGVAAVVVLMAILVVGMVSLARARRHLGRELGGLGAEVPGGALIQARQQRLQQLRGRGTTPDLDALADATAAEEAERAFAGRYLVATTVLVGLVGTFGGLMETLGRLPPLLNAEGAGALTLLTGPLAGLAVTFGASVVAILVTLSLSLAQGDVTLHQERALAALEERTRHLLVPALWPPADTAAERTARELAALRSELSTALAAGAEAGARQIAAVTRAEVKRLVDEIGGAWRATATGQTDAIKRAADEAAAATRKNLDAVTGEVRTHLTAVTTELRTQLDGMTGEVRTHLTAVTTELRAQLDGMTTELRAQLAAVTAATTEQTQELSAATTEHSRVLSAALGEQLGQAVVRLEAGAQRLTEVSAHASAEIERATGAVVARMGETGDGVGQRLEEASAALSGAAGALRAAVDGFAPAIAELAPGLAALSREVALLAARAETQEQPNAVLDELIRLGEDVERLITLTRPPASEEEEGRA